MEKIYTVNENTVAFLPKIDGFGNVHTEILEVDHLIKSHLNPIELVDKNLRNFGSSLTGAHEGTRYILGRVNMCPVIMNHHLVWFPTDSSKKNDCVWLSLNHIKYYQKNTNKSTQIIFTNNSTFTLGVNFNKFKTRISNAYELKCRLENSTTQMFTPPKNKNDFIQFEIVKESKDMNYQIHIKEEEKDDPDNPNIN